MREAEDLKSYSASQLPPLVTFKVNKMLSIFLNLVFIVKKKMPFGIKPRCFKCSSTNSEMWHSRDEVGGFENDIFISTLN